MLLSLIFTFIVLTYSHCHAQQKKSALQWIEDNILSPFLRPFSNNETLSSVNGVNCTTSFCVAGRFVNYGLVPDVLSRAPPQMLRLEWGSKAALLGNKLTVVDTANMPTVISWPTTPNTLYTVAFSDPDVESRSDPFGRSFRHWVVVNVPGTDISRGITVKQYIGPGPPPGSGEHRYNILIYEQNGPINSTDPMDGFDVVAKQKASAMIDKIYTNEPDIAALVKEGINWSPERFAAKFGFRAPIAGNFILIEFAPS